MKNDATLFIIFIEKSMECFSKLTRFIIWNVEQGSNVQWGVGLVVQMETWLVECVGHESVELFVHIIGDVLGI